MADLPIAYVLPEPQFVQIHFGLTGVEIRQSGEPPTWVFLVPKTPDEAPTLAPAFRKMARRFEEIGRGLIHVQQ